LIAGLEYRIPGDYANPVGASVLAMVVNDNACCLNERGADAAQFKGRRLNPDLWKPPDYFREDGSAFFQ